MAGRAVAALSTLMQLDYLNPYACVMRLRRWMYRHEVLSSYHPGIPVISVGNLSLGGTGKSPMTMAIAQHLIDKGKRVAIVSRGYKRKSKGFVLVRNGDEILADVEQSGDEPQMFAERLPTAMVIVDEDRVRGAQHAKALGAEVVVLDDGYQHMRIKRNVNIALINGTQSSFPVLPFGRFREPISALRDADMVVLTQNDVNLQQRNPVYSHIAKECAVVIVHFVADALRPILAEGGPQAALLPLSSLRGKRILALSSIASPERFVGMLQGLGATVLPHSLADHAAYSRGLLLSIVEEASRMNAEMILTTEKDAVKIRPHLPDPDSPTPILVLSQKLEFLNGEDRFYTVIDNAL